MTTASTPAASPRRAAEMRLAERRQASRRPGDAPLVWVAAAVALGAAGSRPVAAWRPEWFALLAVILLAAWFVFHKRDTNKRAVAALLGGVALLAAGWSGVCWRLYAADDVGRFAPSEAEPVCLEVVATAPPAHYAAAAPSPFRAIPSSERTILEARVVKLRDATTWRAATGDCEVTIAGVTEGIGPGDRLLVFGQLSRPQPAMNPGERDRAAADRAERRLARVWTESPECVTKLGGVEATLFTRAVSQWRVGAMGVVDDRLSPSAAPLVRAMLLGDASGLDDNAYEAYRRTGTVHLLVVSGLHVGLVAAAPLAFAAIGLLPRRLAWAMSLLLVVAYVAIVGARPPALRAGIVAVAIGVAALSGRRPISANSLAAAAIVVFVVAPGAWMAAGTRLSFLAAATLVGVAGFAARRRAAFTPPLERLIRSTRSTPERLVRRFGRWVAWGVGATLVVQVVTGPLVASEFHLVSPAAAPLALCVSPLLTLLVSGGLSTLAIEAGGGAWLAAAPAWVTSFAADSLNGVITSAAAVPGAGVWTAGPAAWWVSAWTLWLAIAAAIGAFWPLASGAAWRLGLALVAAAFAPTLWSTFTAGDELRCSFIAVGHGSSTLVETPGGGVVLVDAGALTAPERATDVIARTLWSRGVHQIDALVLTHADADHYNAVPGLLERFKIGSVLTTTLMFPSWDDPTDHSGPAELARLLESSGVPVRTVQAGDRWRLGGAEFLVLHPDDIGVVGSDNANSLVLGIEYAGRRVLLPGDLESPGIDSLLAQEPYDCDLLLAPHHGSARSDPAGFAAWSRPEQVVVSSGEAREAANFSYAGGGAEVWPTHEKGLISATLGRSGVRVWPWMRASVAINRRRAP